MKASNSAPQVSTDLKTGVTPASRRVERYRGFVEARADRRFADRKIPSPWLRGSSAASSGLARDSLLVFDDFGDRVDKPWIDFAELMNFLARDAEPQRVRQIVEAMAVGQSTTGLGCARARPSRASRRCRLSSPYEPISSERSAFCSDSLKVRPIAIASPTDFICGPSSSAAPRNFSNVKRGILVTT